MVKAWTAAAPALMAELESTTFNDEQLAIIKTIAPINANFFILNKFYD
jgi:hypothetical protein